MSEGSEIGNRKSQVASLSDAKRIAIFRLSALGDVVNTLPALSALRRARPDAHIAWVVEAASAGVLEGHPMLDEVLVSGRKTWQGAFKRLRGSWRAAGEFCRFCALLRRKRFDAVIDFQGNLRSAVGTWLTRAPMRVGPGRGSGRERSHWFYNVRLPLPDGPMHRVERGLALVRALGLETADAKPVIPVSDADKAKVDTFLAASGLGAGQFALIHAGTSPFGQYKQWPPDRWAEVARRLAAELGLRAVFTRGPSQSESESAESVARAAGPQALVAPVFSLRELGELCRRCRVFLSVDTGPMHLASAVGAPVVALFGPKNPKVYGPYFGPRAIVEKPLDCRPCRKRSCDDPRCMLAITPDNVLAATKELLG
ncbi:MAG TPA: glycosyltransferase family 9 protein [Planctomycetota bacterium]|nr:glycosyltransferase family 9 protein [Planctomycetota bacterium]